MDSERLVRVLLKKGILTKEEADWIIERPAEITEITVTTNKPKKKKKTKKAEREDLVFDSWPWVPNAKLLNAWLDSKSKKGSISQTTMDTVGKQFHIAVDNGFTVEECLEKAESSGWAGFEASWMKKSDA